MRLSKDKKVSITEAVIKDHQFICVSAPRGSFLPCNCMVKGKTLIGSKELILAAAAEFVMML